MPARFDDLDKDKAKILVQEANLFGQAQKNVELMKEILQTTQQQLDEIYSSIAQIKQEEKVQVQLAESVAAPVAKVSEQSVAALTTIHSNVTKQNEEAKKVEARLMMLVGNEYGSVDYKTELEVNLDILNAQNEALAKLQKKLANLTLIIPTTGYTTVSKKDLGQMISKVEKQLQELQKRNKVLKDKKQMKLPNEKQINFKIKPK